MNPTTRRALLAIATAAAGATGAVAYAAQGGGENDALAIANARIPLVQAIAAAEQHAGGKAAKAEFEHSRQGWVYEVEVVAGTRVLDVQVSAETGAVLSSTPDKLD
ncbi:MAG TPA: PepSY domain-containing protein [Rubrivivax sp.]|nr:PepSY domain-containing protein [Rubrivivax sp.]